jgi:hypothetical protein
MGRITEGTMAYSQTGRRGQEENKKTTIKKLAGRILAHWQERQVEDMQTGRKNCQEKG